MISVHQADQILHDHLFKTEKVSIDIDQAYGRVLAEDLHADRDQPPFDRVTMDGIAIRFKDFENGIRTYKLQAQQFAGEQQLTLNSAPGFCIETATGAALPLEADTIIPYEWMHAEGEQFTLGDFAFEMGKNIHRTGSDLKAGEVVIEAGRQLGSAELAAAVSFGHLELTVYSQPRIAIISTGDELVDEDETPLPHQIRRSNTRAIASLLMQHFEVDAYHIADNVNQLTDSVSALMQNYDVLVFSGGVSKGKRDFLPTILDVLGITKHFHKVKQRPGKPFYFGSTEAVTVFGLPGNPLSAFMCTVRYVLPWLLRSTNVKTRPASAVITTDHQFESPLTLFLPVKSSVIGGQLVATPIRGNGSGDFIQLIGADGFIELHEETTTFNEGEAHPYYPFR
ncbi:MAG: molybdopterin molybdenumtransferase MoeA [Cryomorphaceae bacterium]|nr:molybdopterin molybdenumtransferase MoeA [Cryomorphaceae bacterium]